MKKLLSVLLMIITITGLFTISVEAAYDFNISAKSAILVEADSGTVLFEKKPDDKMLIASTTKIMTGLIVLEECGLDDMVTISDAAAGTEGSSAYLIPGERLSVRELMYALMLSSGNDAAAALAIHVSGSIEAFAEKMNEKSIELGLKNTSFKNPHGLDAEGHYSTARDLAVLTAHALNNNDFKDIVSTKTASVGERNLKNHNRLLWELEGAIGVKTGYTKAAGRILVSAVEREGVRVICVTINASDDWNDHKKLYNEFFENAVIHNICSEDEVYCEMPVMSGNEDTVSILFKKSISIMANNNDVIKTEIELPDFVYAGIKKGDKAGIYRVLLNGKTVAETELIFSDDVTVNDEQKLNFWEKVRRIIRISFKYGAVEYPEY